MEFDNDMGANGENEFFNMNQDNNDFYSNSEFNDPIKKVMREQGIKERKEFLITGDSHSLTKSRHYD